MSSSSPRAPKQQKNKSTLSLCPPQKKDFPIPSPSDLIVVDLLPFPLGAWRGFRRLLADLGFCRSPPGLLLLQQPRLGQARRLGKEKERWDESIHWDHSYMMVFMNERNEKNFNKIDSIPLPSQTKTRKASITYDLWHTQTSSTIHHLPSPRGST